MQKRLSLKKIAEVNTNQSLRELNTFGFEVKADFFVSVESCEEIQVLTQNEIFKSHKRLILSGGSNILFTRDTFDGIVVHINNKGIETIEEDADSVLVRAQAGEVWKDFVVYCVEKGWYGLENLSAIPGKVGASPVQNIGAYGAEAKDCIERVHAICIADGSIRTFSNAECRFGYRQSAFKQELKDQFIICAVDYRLKKYGTLNLGYGNIRSYLEANGTAHPTLSQLAEAICRIRASKLPPVEEIGSAGSFFKNPVIGRTQFEELAKQYPDMPSYDEPDGMVKVPAGWLIDRCGWKGFRDNSVGVYDKQALVLVHYGGGCGADIVELSQKIQNSVANKFGINILPEVVFI